MRVRRIPLCSPLPRTPQLTWAGGALLAEQVRAALERVDPGSLREALLISLRRRLARGGRRPPGLRQRPGTEPTTERAAQYRRIQPETPQDARVQRLRIRGRLD